MYCDCSHILGEKIFLLAKYVVLYWFVYSVLKHASGVYGNCANLTRQNEEMHSLVSVPLLVFYFLSSFHSFTFRFLFFNKIVTLRGRLPADKNVPRGRVL
jgi:hypothetical protein